MNIVHQPRTLLVRGRNTGMGTAAGADELVDIPQGLERREGGRVSGLGFRVERLGFRLQGLGFRV